MIDNVFGAALHHVIFSAPDPTVDGAAGAFLRYLFILC